jgi:hypothetical protein
MKRRLAGRILESSEFFPVLTRKRRAVVFWLITSHGAQITLVLLFLFMQFVFPDARDAVLDRLFPESFSGKLVAVFGGDDTATSRRNAAGAVATTMLWICGGALAALLTWVRVPAALARTATIARQHEAAADDLIETTPTRSVLLYRSALALACHADYEKHLEQKLREIDERLSPATGEGTTGSTPAAVGTAVAGRYTIIEELGRGANGVVYRAKDEVLGRDVALKALPVPMSNDDSAVPRFRQEARALAKLNHPNIVQVYDFIEHERRMWTAIELVEGGDLAAYLAERNRLSVPEACAIGARIAEGVAFAHNMGVIHRDLKPLNVLLAGGITPKVTDFGLAKLADGGIDTLEGTIMGSPYYMSPEQARGDSVTHSTDIYSLGIILYQMLSGRVPFEGDIATILAQHIRKPPRPLRDLFPDGSIPPALDRLVMVMLAKKAKKRPRGMREVAAALDVLSRSVARS